jgi:hypothetical protein
VAGVLVIKPTGRTAAAPSNASLTSPKSGPAIPPAAESGLLPWQLQAPLSRMLVYPGQSANQLVLAGGLTAAKQSSSGIYTLDLTNGTLAQTATLPEATHDAAGAVTGGNYGMFGGGNTNSFSRAITFDSNGKIFHSGSLPEARSDDTAVSVGGTTYIVGGYSGSQGDAEVLATNDGSGFTAVGRLPVPVRYPAVAALDGKIYVFGGEAIGSGLPVDSVQIISVADKTVSLAAWKLPVPLEGAMAFTINNELFLAGGQSSTPETISPGVGTTQVPGINVAAQSLTQNSIWALDAAHNRMLNAGTLQVPVSNAGVAVSGSRAWIIGGEYNGQVVGTVQMVTPNSQFGSAGQAGAGSPYFGSDLLVADRGNDRLLVLNPAMATTWSYPPAPGAGFYFPDDAFFANHGSEIITNEENNNTVMVIGYPSGKPMWSFGHPLQAGSAEGYLSGPDDAYILKNNNLTVADDKNCRILFISPAGQVIGQIGTTGVCIHNPNVSLGSPNGDTPLADGNVLVSEIRGQWISEYTPKGHAVWTVHLPIYYPSDPQQVGASATSNPDHYLVADYAWPGSILQFTRSGKILSEYHVNSGPGELKDPSLAELLPSGVYMANDDTRDRMVALDPATNALVWQYGVSDTPGAGTGMLKTPDGFDLLSANGTTPTHPTTK